MDIKILQESLLQKMAERGFNMKSLSQAANLNETAVRDIIRGRVNNPSFNSLDCLAKALGCSLSDLVFNNGPVPDPGYYMAIDNREMFIKAVIRIDNLIAERNLQLPASEKAKLYLAWYEMILLNQKIDADKATAYSYLNGILKYIGR